MLLVRWSETGDERMLRTVTRTLRSMQGRPIRDELDGGFYRYATERDWSAPSAEKPLLSNAKRLLAYAEAYQVLGEPSFRDTALDIAAWMDRALRDEETGAYRAGEELHPEAARRAPRRGARRCPPHGRSDHPRRQERLGGHGPPEDGARPRGAWSRPASSRRPRLRPRADVRSIARRVRLLERHLEPAWRPEAAGGRARSLVDAVHTASANRYLDPARAIAAWTDEHLSASDGSFRGDLHQRELPAVERSTEDLKANALMAEGLLRLAVLTGEDRWQARTDGPRGLPGCRALPRVRGGGLRPALDLLVHAPLHVTIAGPADDPLRADLARAARRPYVASRVTLTVDPAGDPDWRRG